MRILGGRKLLTLLKIIFILSCIVIAIAFISSQKPKKLGDIMQYLDETISTGKKFYSNRKKQTSVFVKDFLYLVKRLESLNVTPIIYGVTKV